MEAAIVFLIVAAAACYAGWNLMPGRLRRWIVARVGALAPSRRAWLARIDAKAEEGACGSCRGCATDASPPAGQARHAAQSTIRIHRRVERQSPQ